MLDANRTMSRYLRGRTATTRAGTCTRLPGQQALRIRLAFRDFVGRYLIHCHNMNHEDAFMMVRWDIVETVAELRRAEARDQCSNA